MLTYTILAYSFDVKLVVAAANANVKYALTNDRILRRIPQENNYNFIPVPPPKNSRPAEIITFSQ